MNLARVMDALFPAVGVLDGTSAEALHRAAWEDPAMAGPRLMAMDEALSKVDCGTPMLRLYTWEAAWTSVGYFEKFVAPWGARMMRRWTGGGVVHHRPGTELTYALAIPREHPFFAVRPAESYLRIHIAVQRALQACGVAAELSVEKPSAPGGMCFEKPMPGDVMMAVGDRFTKLAGAGQRRHRGGLLHQGSIQLPMALPRGLQDQIEAAFGTARGLTPASVDRILEESALLMETRYATERWNRPAVGVIGFTGNPTGRRARASILPGSGRCGKNPRVLP